jgi:uncharacterized lipoprotein YehR (DUF1307 family)
MINQQEGLLKKSQYTDKYVFLFLTLDFEKILMKILNKYLKELYIPHEGLVIYYLEFPLKH